MWRGEYAQYRRRSQLVFDAVWPTGIVAACDLGNPVRRVPSDMGNGFGGETARQGPEEVPVTALDRIPGDPITSSEFIWAKMRFEMDGSRHAPLCTTVHPGRNPPAGMKMGARISVGGRHTVVPGAGQQFARGVAPHRPLSRPTMGSTQESMTKQQTPH